MTKRTLFIGDVHGCLDELKDLLGIVDYQKNNDRLIYLGDILNKGPKSFETMKYIREQNVECLLGNNEIAFLNVAKNGGHRGSSLSELVNELGDALKSYCEWIETFPHYIEEDDFIAVHAGLEPNKSVEKTSKKVLTTIRTWDGIGKNLNDPTHPNWYELYKGDKTIIYGHYAAQKLQINEKTIGLDSGCVFGGELSCLIWPTREVVQVKARRQYLAIHSKV